MNEQSRHDRTAGDLDSPIHGATAADPFRTTDHDRGTGSTANTLTMPGTVKPALELPVIPGYRVLRELARGGMGRVLAAYDVSLERDVAIKTLLPRANPERFLRESKITAQLPHPGIPPVYALGTLADGTPYLAMKLISGSTLAAEMKHADRSSLLMEFVQVCQAVGFAHSRGIIHRDLKPSNVMVGAFGEVHVMDWGLAKDLATSTEAHLLPAGVAPNLRDSRDVNQTVDAPPSDDSEAYHTQAGTVLGTPAYLAPEVAAGQPATTASDIYGLGAILHALLTGRAPYTGTTVTDLLNSVMSSEPYLFLEPKADVPPGLVAICRRAMARDPRNRYATAEELAADIRRWLTDEPVTVYREPWTARAARWARRRKTAVVAAAVLLLTATVASVATAGIVWAEQRQTKKEWERAEAETVKANENAETALTVVRDLSSYVNFIETSEGVTDQKRKTMLDAALTSYERLLALHPGDPELKSNVARTHRYRANLSRLVNDLDEAERSYREANRLYKALADGHPDEPRYRIDLALGSRDYALLVRTRGRLKDSLAILSESIQLYDGLHKAEPSKASLQRTLAIVLLDRAELEFQLGDLAGTEQDARRARDLYAALADAVDYKAELLDPLFRSMAEVRLAVTLRELNRIEEALTVHNQVVERLDGLAKLSATRDHLHELARARGERAVTWAKIPDKRAAGIAEFDLAINACEKLAKQFPQFPAYQRSQGMWTMQRGRLNKDLGKSAAAASDAAAATAILEGLVAKYPAIPIYRSFLGQIYILRGQLETDAGKSAGWYVKARDTLNAALTTSPDNALDRKALSDVEALVRTSKP